VCVCVCDHRGISLLLIPGKILSRVILNRLTKHVCDNILPDGQCGFRAGRSTMYMIFTARQLQEKCREHQRELYAVFVDLTKAFDSVDRSALWEIMLKIGCPHDFVTIIRSFHDGMTAMVVENGRVLTQFRRCKWHEAGLCPGSTLVHHLLFHDAFSSIQRLHSRHPHSLPH